MRADAVGAFAHTRQAPVSFAAGLQEVCVDASPVIPYDHIELFRRIGQLHFDLLRAGVTKRVNERFPSDAIDFVAEEWV